MVRNSRKRLFWVTLMYVDIALHKTSRIEILRNLSKRGYDVTLLAAYSKAKPSSENLGVNVISIPVRKVPFLSSLFLSVILTIILPLIVLTTRPDDIIVEPQSGAFLALLAMRAIPRSVRPKIIVDVRSPPVEIKGLAGWLFTLCFQIGMLVAREFMDGITTITSMMRRDLCAKFNIDSNSVGVWTSGVSTETFAPVSSSIEKKLRHAMGLNGKFVVIYHGVVTTNRGVREAIASIKLLRRKYNDVTLLILGAGPALQGIKATSHQEIAEGRVILHSPVKYEQVPRYISACDVGIVPLPDIPDWRNQCALNLLECLAMAKVVIATDIPANRNVAGKSKCVVYAPSSDARGIARAIRYAFDNKKSLRKWGARGRRLVEEKYAWKRVAESLDRYMSSR